MSAMKKYLLAFFLLFGVFLLPVSHASAYFGAQDITVSNVVFNPTDGSFSYNYSGRTLDMGTPNSLNQIYDITDWGQQVAGGYFTLGDVCTATHCSIPANIYTVYPTCSGCVPYVAGHHFGVRLADINGEARSNAFRYPELSSPAVMGATTAVLNGTQLSAIDILKRNTLIAGILLMTFIVIPFTLYHFLKAVKEANRHY